MWVCDLCIPQNSDLQVVDGLPKIVESIGAVVMAADDWRRPAPLARVWCLAELHTAFVCGARFGVAMGEAQAADFLQMFLDDERFGDMLQMVADISVAKAGARKAEDKERILAEVERTAEGGIAGLDKLVAAEMRAFFERVGERILREADAEAEGGGEGGGGGGGGEGGG